MNKISDRFHLIQEQIAKVAKGRPISVVAVTKHQPIEKVREAIDAKINCLAVNYAQEGELLRGQFTDPNLEWHFIGHIQSRKIKYLVNYHTIQSMDRIEIAEALNKKLEETGKGLYCLVEVNIGREPQKSGVFPEKLEAFLNELVQFENIKVNGLMAMPPPLEPVEARRKYFQQMKQLFEQAQKIAPMEVLSMGTTEDYLIAIEEGATMVRLGTILFGPRP